MLDLSVIILTYNEERHIARCIDNVKHIAKQVYVVDSYSTDKTCDIAREHGAIVLQNKYVNQSQQFIWAMDNCQVQTAWTMRMDADEYLTEKLIDELNKTIPSLPVTVSGCRFPLVVAFLGRKLKYGKIRKIMILRLWRTGLAQMEQRWMDERCYVTEGEVIDLKHEFIDENLNGLTEWTQKHNNYANREIVAAYEGGWSDFVSGGNGLESRNKEKGKYYKLPKFLRAFVYFFVRYICFGGFLDGKPGFIWATLQAYWYRFLVDAKIEEMEFCIGRNPTPQEMRSYFKERFNINVDK